MMLRTIWKTAVDFFIASLWANVSARCFLNNWLMISTVLGRCLFLEKFLYISPWDILFTTQMWLLDSY